MKRGDVKQQRVTASKPSQNKSFKELADEFLRQAEIRNLSEWTIKSYKYHTQYFIEFAGEELLCRDVGLDLLEEYILYMKNVKGLNNAVTLNSYLKNVSPIIKYGIKKRYIINDFMLPVIAGQETFKEIYTDEEIKALLETPAKKDFISIRTYTIIWMLSSTGIRARELRELRNKNVDMINRAITVNETKNKKPRRLPISKSFYDVLLAYIEIRGGDAEDYLFPTHY